MLVWWEQEFFRGSLSKNPLYSTDIVPSAAAGGGGGGGGGAAASGSAGSSSSTISGVAEATMRDLRDKIATDLDMADAVIYAVLTALFSLFSSSSSSSLSFGTYFACLIFLVSAVVERKLKPCFSTLPSAAMNSAGPTRVGLGWRKCVLLSMRGRGPVYSRSSLDVCRFVSTTVTFWLSFTALFFFCVCRDGNVR